ncbi:hypothetical protein GT94_00640 [Geobacillus stearothermophilus]|nr:hypothetical protein GARCT_03138 [Geobacillus sp. 12AMOR1]KFL14670.1 hypothetical protein ET31_16740 [Geobacillus stearothermophilus]STO13650.1 Uncharacterised protein [[Flavobacterium] thermophilum]KFX36914.1 hypothetical protein GT94_00640 [Geobacillus stearothermophilus]KZE97382.1 hypothetical protein AVP43_00636 [Geobacillus stearothermophilus]
MIKSVLNRAHRAISTSKVFAHESLVELESVSMRRYGRSSIVHKNPVALAIGRFRDTPALRLVTNEGAQFMLIDLPKEE